MIRTLLRKATDPIFDFKRSARLRAAPGRRSLFTETVFLGVTGSHGKSTSTALLGKMLSTKAPTYSGIYRNTSRAIVRGLFLAKPRRHRYFVQEVSGHAPGSVSRSVDLLKPSVGIVTAVGGDHRKAFAGSHAATAAEKAKLVHSLPENGLAVLNADDPLVAAMANGCRCRVVTFGRADGADLRLNTASSQWPNRLTFDVEYRGDRFTVRSRLVGEHWTLSIQAALLTALELGANQSACLEVIASFEPLFNRMSVHPAPHGAWYVLDAYKASYFGTEACVDFLAKARAPRKSAVFGSISDRPSGGDRKRYTAIARQVLASADRVFFTGQDAARLRKLAGEEFPGRLFVVDKPEDVRKSLSEDAVPGELIYVKATSANELHNIFVPERNFVARWMQSSSSDGTT